MEDIINRGGGNLLLELRLSDSGGQFTNEPVAVSIDGRAVTAKPGETIRLRPGESIALVPGQYHRWVGRARNGPSGMLFEVSSTNDDNVDNRFHSASGRLPVI